MLRRKQISSYSFRAERGTQHAVAKTVRIVGSICEELRGSQANWNRKVPNVLGAKLKNSGLATMETHLDKRKWKLKSD